MLKELQKLRRKLLGDSFEALGGALGPPWKALGGTCGARWKLLGDSLEGSWGLIAGSWESLEALGDILGSKPFPMEGGYPQFGVTVWGPESDQNRGKVDQT